ncbi:hypothetical protein ACHAXR_002228 [Thalassiosira sp. AJA248-18]
MLSILNAHLNIIPASARALAGFTSRSAAVAAGSTTSLHHYSSWANFGTLKPSVVLDTKKQLLATVNGGGNTKSMSTSSDDDAELANNLDDAMQSYHVNGRSYSLAHRASSPELFAKVLNMTVQQVDEVKRSRRASATALDERLVAFENEHKHNMTAGEIGKRKHEMICHHRHEYLRKPFVCKKCWTHRPICVCPLFERADRSPSSSEEGNALDNSEKKQSKASLPKGVERVIVWTHHDEWGRTSNTGSLLPLGLERTDMLMKGLDKHEQIMNELFSRDDLTFVVLWPGKGGDNTTTTISELQSRIAPNKHSAAVGSDKCANITGGIVLISIEGTWNTARKMASKLPANVLRLDLGEDVVSNFTTPEMNEGIFYNSNSTKTSAYLSLLAPLRRQGKGKDGKMENVSTLEATIVALLALGLKVDDASRILRVARTKVDRLLEYQGKIKR